MRVTIEQKEKTTGLLRKTTTYLVVCTIDFSAEERHIIKARKLETHRILTTAISKDTPLYRDHGIKETHVTLDQFLKPYTSEWKTPAEAKNFEARLTAALPAVKELLSDNASIEQGVKTFDL